MREWLEKHWTWRTACLVAAALVVVLILARPYTRYPGGETDQVAYMLQARILASGHVSAPAPPPELRTYLLTRHCVTNDRFFAHYWPFTSALYAVPLALGISWYVMHALCYGAAGLFAFLALRGTRGGIVAGVCAQLGVYGLLAERAWTANSMVPTFAAAMLAVWAARRALTQWSVGWGALGGLAIAAAVLGRPLTGAVLGASIGVGLVLGVLRRWRRWRVALAYGLLVLVAAVVQLGYNASLTGDAFKPPFHVFAPENTLFFGMRGFQDPIVYFGPKDAFANFRVLVEQFWFILAGCAAVVMLLRRRSVESDPIVPVSAVAGVVLGVLYCCYFGFEQTTARYLREIALVLLPFFAWAIGRASAWAVDGRDTFSHRMLVTALVLVFAVTTPLALATRGATAWRRTVRFKQTLSELDRLTGGEPAVVVLKRPAFSLPSERNWRLGALVTYLYNDPWLRGRRLYAVEREGRMDALVKAYRPSHRLFLVEIDPDTGQVEDITPPKWRDQGAGGNE